MVGIQSGTEMICFLIVGTKGHNGTARKDEAHHIENGWNASFSALFNPSAVMCGGESLPTEFCWPMDSGESRLKDESLPRCAFFN